MPNKLSLSIYLENLYKYFLTYLEFLRHLRLLFSPCWVVKPNNRLGGNAGLPLPSPPQQSCPANTHFIPRILTLGCSINYKVKAKYFFTAFSLENVDFNREVRYKIHSKLGLVGSGSETIYSGSGSGSFKKFRIRPDPDPQHWRKQLDSLDCR